MYIEITINNIVHLKMTFPLISQSVRPSPHESARQKKLEVV